MAEYIRREAAVEMVKRICNLALDARRTHLDVVDDGVEMIRGITSIPAANVAPVEKLEHLRNELCELDLITMEGLKKLNTLIGKYTQEHGGGAENV